MSSIVDLDVTDRSGVPVVTLSGEVDMSVTDGLAEHLDGVARDGSPGVVVDLTELEYLDSAGLALLLRLKKGLEERGQRLRLVVASDTLVANLFAITRANAIIPVDASVDEALAALAAPPSA